MKRDDERLSRVSRASEAPIVSGLPDYPGILAALMISPDLARPMGALADALLVRPFAGATIMRSDRELLATAVSAANDCFFCMDSHGAFAAALLAKAPSSESEQIVESVKVGEYDVLSPKLRALIAVALQVRHDARGLTVKDVQQARSAGASDQDIQLAVMIAAAFCMYNKIVDGFRAKTFPYVSEYHARAGQIVEFGYDSEKLGMIRSGE
jgi:uncharacterized peroxidase-related enzyme